MSQAASTSTSGNINYTDPNAGKWLPWAIGGAVIVAIFFFLKKGKKP